MKKEIQDIINENLPAQTAGELRKYIEKQEGMEVELTEARTLIKQQDEQLKDYAAREKAFDNNEARAKELHLRALELDEQERNMKITLNEQKLGMMRDNMDNMKELVNKVFGHPSVTISGYRDTPYTDQYGNRNSESNWHNETHTETKE